METYSLYYTLNKKVTSKKFPISKRKDLVTKAKELDDAGKEAFLMLICEHARLKDDFSYTPENETLPYQGEQKGKDLVFNVNNFPDQLCWILSKFLGIIHKS